MDKRRQLRAHWPPRRTNVLAVQVGPEVYRDLYMEAQVRDRSLADEVRFRLPRPAVNGDDLIAAFEHWWRSEAADRVRAPDDYHSPEDFESYSARKLGAYKAFAAGWREKR